MPMTLRCLLICPTSTSAFDKLNSCLQDVQEWMLSSMLKLSDKKTEFIICASHAQLKKLDYSFYKKSQMTMNKIFLFITLQKFF